MLLARNLVFLSFLLGRSLLLSKPLARCLQLADPLKLLLVLQKPESFFFLSFLAASFLLSRLGLKPKSLSLCEFLASLGLGSLLPDSLFLDLESQLLFFLLLFADNSQILLRLGLRAF